MRSALPFSPHGLNGGAARHAPRDIARSTAISSFPQPCRSEGPTLNETRRPSTTPLTNRLIPDLRTGDVHGPQGRLSRPRATRRLNRGAGRRAALEPTGGIRGPLAQNVVCLGKCLDRADWRIVAFPLVHPRTESFLRSFQESGLRGSRYYGSSRIHGHPLHDNPYPPRPKSPRIWIARWRQVCAPATREAAAAPMRRRS